MAILDSGLSVLVGRDWAALKQSEPKKGLYLNGQIFRHKKNCGHAWLWMLWNFFISTVKVCELIE